MNLPKIFKENYAVEELYLDIKSLIPRSCFPNLKLLSLIYFCDCTLPEDYNHKIDEIRFAYGLSEDLGYDLSGSIL